MILLALLVGSDYTVGIPGIGPVTALEILAAFPPPKNLEISYLSQSDLLSGLKEFKHWLYDGGHLGRGRTTLRSKLQNIQISDGFPSLQVVQAYLQPEVETSEEHFSWGKPDVVGLIDFAREKFGWTRTKAEEILNPVIKKLEDSTKQKSIKDYFTIKHKIEIDIPDTKMSKRVKVAIEKIGKTKEELDKEEEENEKKSKSKKRSKEKVNTEKSKENKPRRTKSTKKHEKQDNQNGKEIEQTTETEKTDDKPKIQRRRRSDIHKKEEIPQKEYAKISALRSKLKAIEVYRKSNIDKKTEKRVRKTREPKEDAGLSESSDSS